VTETVTIGQALLAGWIECSAPLVGQPTRPKDFFDGPATELVQGIIEQHLSHASEQFSTLMHREVVGELQAIHKVVCESTSAVPANMMNAERRAGYAAGADAARTEMANAIRDYGQELRPRAVKMKAERAGPVRSEGGVLLP